MPGRPTKFIRWFEEMKAVLEDPRSVILTDKELWIAVNARLDKSDRVALSTFEFWQSETQNPNSPENLREVTPEMAEDFRLAMQSARVSQKMNLTGDVLDKNNKNQWGSSWVLERKFSDLKLNKGLQIGDGNTQINITVGNPEHKTLVEDILSGNTIDIEHEEVKPIPKKLDEHV